MSEFDADEQHASHGHPTVARVREALIAAGATDTAAGIRAFHEATPTAASAAAALGCEVGAIANSLLFNADGAALLVMTSGAHRVDTTKVAALVGATKVKRAEADFVRDHTGQVIGGVAPLGHPAHITTLVDRDLAQYPVIWAAAGHPHTVFPTTYDELVTVTNGTPAEVA